jgi:hypothetical protein
MALNKNDSRFCNVIYFFGQWIFVWNARQAQRQAAHPQQHYSFVDYSNSDLRRCQARIQHNAARARLIYPMRYLHTSLASQRTVLLLLFHFFLLCFSRASNASKRLWGVPARCSSKEAVFKNTFVCRRHVEYTKLLRRLCTSLRRIVCLPHVVLSTL